MATIHPTIGRVVWFTPDNNDTLVVTDNVQPCAALIAYVHSDRLVNLAVFDHDGSASTKQDVPLVQEDDDERPHGYYCEWMPYQKGQAAKTEALEKQVAAA